MADSRDYNRRLEERHRFLNKRRYDIYQDIIRERLFIIASRVTLLTSVICYYRWLRLRMWRSVQIGYSYMSFGNTRKYGGEQPAPSGICRRDWGERFNRNVLFLRQISEVHLRLSIIRNRYLFTILYPRLRICERKKSYAALLRNLSSDHTGARV